MTPREPARLRGRPLEGTGLNRNGNAVMRQISRRTAGLAVIVAVDAELPYDHALRATCNQAGEGGFAEMVVRINCAIFEEVDHGHVR